MKKDPRLKKINELFVNYATGNFNYRIEISDKRDELDAFISNINMLGEELKSTTISKNFFNNIFNSVSDMLFIMDDKGLIKDINLRVSEMIGMKSSELIGQPMKILNKDCHNLSYQDIFKKLNKSNNPVEFETVFITKKEKHVPVYCSCSQLISENEKNPFLVIIAKDLTRTKLFEKRIKESEEKYKNIFQNSSDCNFILDKTEKIINLNTAGYHLLQLSEKEPVNFYLKNLFIKSSDYSQIKKDLKYQESITDFKTKIISKNNTKHILISLSKIKNEHDEFTGYQGIIKDNSQLKETENIIFRTIVKTQEQERDRFAKDLHDSLGQQLSGIKLQMEVLKISPNISKRKYEQLITKTNNDLKAAITELRRVCFNIMPRTLKTFGLSFAIKELCRKVNEYSNIKFDINYYKNVPALDKQLEINLFRIIQEFINNSIKHGQCSEIKILVNFNKTVLHILLKDNGIGFNKKNLKKTESFGITNMKSRVDAYDGDIKITSSTGKGTSCEIFIPLKKTWYSN